MNVGELIEILKKYPVYLDVFIMDHTKNTINYLTSVAYQEERYQKKYYALDKKNKFAQTEKIILS